VEVCMVKVIEISYSELDLEALENVALQDIPALMLKHRRDEVIKAYCEAFGFTPERLAEYEGGIDEWIGFGSVTCYELGGGTLVGFGFNTIQMAILTG